MVVITICCILGIETNNNKTLTDMTNSIKQAKQLESKFFNEETGRTKRDFTPYFSRKAKDLLDRADDEIYEFDSYLHGSLLIIAYPDRQI